MNSITDAQATLIVAGIQLFTTLALAFVGWRVRNLETRLKATEHLQSKTIDWRLDIYREMAPLLNDLLCFMTYRGHWRSIDPEQVLSHKRIADACLSKYKPFLGRAFPAQYHRFIDLCFQTFNGVAEDAKIRSGSASHRLNPRYTWQPHFDSMFVLDPAQKSDKAAIVAAYDAALAAFASDLGFQNRSSASPAPIVSRSCDLTSSFSD